MPYPRLPCFLILSIAFHPLVALSAENLAGPDANHNGIRDDIDRYIAQTFSDAPSKAAAEQMAKAVQQSLIDANDHNKSLANATSLDRAVECMGSIRGEAGDDAVMRIESMTINTPARAKAYDIFDGQLDGGYFKGTAGSDMSAACTHK